MENNIVVFGKFENTIEANIVKTKLDAYGIPCFLTEENVSNLYPGQRFVFFNVRLHLFASDLARAHQIMSENNQSYEETIIVCPKCKSPKVKTGIPASWLRRTAALLFRVVTISSVPATVHYQCENCGTEFKHS